MKLQLHVLKQDSNMDVPGLIRKLHEEVREVYEANAYYDDVELIKETLDVIQVCTGILDIVEKEHIDLEKLFQEHNKKLKDRKWEFKKTIDINL